jgi:bacterioferritin
MARNGGFRIDVDQIRKQARVRVEEAAVVPTYRADRAAVLKLLDEALATELVCALRYRRHYHMARGTESRGPKEQFLEHAREEEEHAQRIAERIVQLDGEPDLDPARLAARAHSQYVEGASLVEMIREDLVAERIAIQSYSEMIQFIGASDPTSRTLLEEILANEEEHAEEMLSLLPVEDGAAR